MSISGKILVYSGKGTWDSCVKQTEQMLKHHLDEDRVEFIDSITEPLDENVGLLVVPGGISMVQMEAIGQIGFERIGDYVNKGGRYCGICAGALIQTERWISKARPNMFQAYEDLTQRAENGQMIYPEVYNHENIPQMNSQSLFKGLCISPLVIKKDIDFMHPGNAIALDVVDQVGEVFKAFHYSGPAFLEVPSEADVILRYKEPVNVTSFKRIGKLICLGDISYHDPNPAALLTCPSGEGKILISGIHPEVDPFTFDESECALPKGLKEDNHHRVELVKTMMKALE